LFASASDTWSTGGELSVPRALHRALKLPGSQRPMVAGGTPQDSPTPSVVYASAEIFGARTLVAAASPAGLHGSSQVSTPDLGYQ
jgi:hypothetical protein